MTSSAPIAVSLRRPGPLFVFAGGGTGGHLYPALSVAHEIRRLEPGARILFLCTGRPVDRQILEQSGFDAMAQAVRPFSTRPWHWPGFIVAWRGAIRRCRSLFLEDRPAFVIGAGGYGSDPPVRAALRLGIRTAILNPDYVPGRANMRLGRRVDMVFAQWEGTREYFPDAARFRAWGCPIRPSFGAACREDGLIRFGLQPSYRTLLVTGASQGARTINQAMMAVAGMLAEVGGWQVLHLAGRTDADRVRAAYQSAGVPAVVLPFTDHMPEAMAAADLALSRAGASTLAELTAVGLPSILLPYPFHRDQHQLRNAEVLRSAGAAEIVIDRVDPTVNAAAISALMRPLLRDPTRLGQMSQAARRLGRPEAAARIAEELLLLSCPGSAVAVAGTAAADSV